MKKWRNVLLLLVSLTTMLSFVACSASPDASETAGSGAVTSAEPIETDAEAATDTALPTGDATTAQPRAQRILVAYYSASGNTRRVAEVLASELNADIFEITPVVPYTSSDLDWRASGSRVNQEHDDESLRDIALTQTTPDDWDKYDVVLIGYPIWWGIAAWPVNNFVKSNDLTGKTVIPFATSSSSGLGQSGVLLSEMASSGTWQDGRRFSSGVSAEDVRAWAQGLC